MGGPQDVAAAGVACVPFAADGADAGRVRGGGRPAGLCAAADPDRVERDRRAGRVLRRRLLGAARPAGRPLRRRRRDPARARGPSLPGAGPGRRAQRDDPAVPGEPPGPRVRGGAGAAGQGRRGGDLHRVPRAGAPRRRRDRLDRLLRGHRRPGDRAADVCVPGRALLADRQRQRGRGRRRARPGRPPDPGRRGPGRRPGRVDLHRPAVHRHPPVDPRPRRPRGDPAAGHRPGRAGHGRRPAGRQPGAGRAGSGGADGAPGRGGPAGAGRGRPGRPAAAARCPSTRDRTARARTSRRR